MLDLTVEYKLYYKQDLLVLIETQPKTVSV